MAKALVVLIQAQSAGRDVDKHVASLLPPAKPRASRVAAGTTLFLLLQHAAHNPNQRDDAPDCCEA